MHLLQNAPSKDQIKFSVSGSRETLRKSKVKPSILVQQTFSRLVVLLERCPDTPIPTSLFIDNMMRKSNKASLLNFVLGKDYQLITPSEILTTDVSVVDGGAVLRKTTRKQGIKFKDIVSQLLSWMGMEIALQRKITSNQGDLATQFQR